VGRHRYAPLVAREEKVTEEKECEGLMSSDLTASLGFLYAVFARFRFIEGNEMDLLMILGTIAFFLVAIAYTIACDKLK
jgi:hypothetical protein